MSDPRYCVIGPGAVGSLIIHALNTAGIVPRVVTRSAARAGELVSAGAHIITLSGRVSELELDPAPPEGLREGECDVMIFAVKAYDIEEAARRVKRALSSSGIAVSVQNGLGPLEVLEDVFGHARSAQLVLNHGVSRAEGGAFRWVGGSESYLGQRGGTPSFALLERVAKDLSLLSVRVVRDIEPLRWLKLCVNAGINPVTALLRQPNAVIAEVGWAGEVAALAARECHEVAEALGIRLPRDPVAELLRVAEATADNVSSMAQDLIRCRRTEIDYINGKVVEKGEEAGVSTAVNRVLANLVRAAESVCGGEGLTSLTAFPRVRAGGARWGR